MISSAFENFVDPLEAEGFGAWYEDTSEGSPISSLFAVMHVDEKNRRYVVQAIDARELAEKAFPEAGKLPMPLLQIAMQFPFEVPALCFADTARILHRLNVIIPVGGFILSEEDGTVCYRAIAPLNEAGLSVEGFVSTLKIIRYFCVESAGLIEAIATAQMSYTDATDLIKNSQLPEQFNV